ncbi:hypothetical protein pqer_cds_1061 [Pandoravirus quercus]|uniref:Uncharacterized protein n=1 Tax=Pandoravirus quercus TaxID=2107709 RepID=A0A2U7UAL6_9VIRU|nr:hypothetical protein pqer_cds_1061 [Pandoravirus quercus]AVK75483.1 hypothetical protein pqer_cds_1061 [Pandoravirus quercus]
MADGTARSIDLFFSPIVVSASLCIPRPLRSIAAHMPPRSSLSRHRICRLSPCLPPPDQTVKSRSAFFWMHHLFFFLVTSPSPPFDSRFSAAFPRALSPSKFFYSGHLAVSFVMPFLLYVCLLLTRPSFFMSGVLDHRAATKKGHPAIPPLSG